MKKFLVAIIAVLALSASAMGGYSDGSYFETFHKFLTITNVYDTTTPETYLCDTAVQWFEIDGSKIKIKLRYNVDTAMASDTVIIKWTSFPHRPIDDTPADTGWQRKMNEDTITNATAAWIYDSAFYKIDSLEGYRHLRLQFIYADSVENTDADSALTGNTYIDSLEVFIEVWE